MIKKLSDKWLIVPIVLLLISFLYRLIDQSKMLSFFPLDYINDWSSYMAQLHFLKECGFHQYCQYWYNGFVSFLITPPGWYFFAYPLLILFNDVLHATYFSMILLYLLGFIFIYYLGKSNKYSLLKIIAFFLFFFANPIALGNHVRQGRITELFSFVVLIPFVILIFKYKSEKLNKRLFLLLSLVYAVLILAHFQEAFLFSFLFLGLFLYKKKFDKLYILLIMLLGIILSSFWLIPFLANIKNKLIFSYEQAKYLTFSKGLILTNIVSIIVPLSLLILFYLYYKTKSKSKGEALFYLPILSLSFLFLFRLVQYIPFLKNISPDIYNLFFLFFAIYFLFTLDLNKISLMLRKFIIYMLILISIASLVVSVSYTPKFRDYGDLEEEFLDVLSSIDGSFLIAETSDGVTSYPKAYYSMAPIYYNIRTPSGWYPHIIDYGYKNRLYRFTEGYWNKDCGALKEATADLEVSYIISTIESCEFLKGCGFNFVRNTQSLCLVKA
ncbi:MAG: 6-pyruvoyl-tetrahydropterin synthase-related protein [Nanoarchaeota archaeon]